MQTQLLLIQQHRNDRHDAVEIVQTHFSELEKVTNGLIEHEETCLNAIVRDIMNMPQRKPDGIESLPASLNIKELAKSEAEKYQAALFAKSPSADIVKIIFEDGVLKGHELSTCLYAEKMELMGRMAKQLEKIKHGSGTPEKFMETKSLLDEWNKLNQE